MKYCIKCGKEFSRPYSCSKLEWENRKFCSRQCMKKGEIRNCAKCGKQFYAKKCHIVKGWMNYCSISCSKKGKIPPNLEIARANSPIKPGNTMAKCLKGRKRPLFSDEWKKNMGLAFRKSPLNKGENHWNWKGGITESNHKIRTSTQYKDWRMSVLKRDHFSCVECGYRSKQDRDVVVDHIKPFSLFPRFRIDQNNGRTLCRPCDRKLGFHHYRDQNNTLTYS